MTEFGEELGEVLGVISEEVPCLLRAVTRMLSFPFEGGIKEAAASFYEELHDAGIPDRTALKLTEDYVSVFTNRAQEVMEQAIGTETLHKARTEIAGKERETRKRLSDRFLEVKDKIKKTFRLSRS